MDQQQQAGPQASNQQVLMQMIQQLTQGQQQLQQALQESASQQTQATARMAQAFQANMDQQLKIHQNVDRALTFEIEVSWKASLSLTSSQDHLEPGACGTTSSRHGLNHVTRMQSKLSRSWSRQYRCGLSQRGHSRTITLMGTSLFQLRLVRLWSPWQKVRHWRSSRTPREEPILGWKLWGGCCASMLRRILKQKFCFVEEGLASAAVLFGQASRRAGKLGALEEEVWGEKEEATGGRHLP